MPRSILPVDLTKEELDLTQLALEAFEREEAKQFGRPQHPQLREAIRKVALSLKPAEASSDLYTKVRREADLIIWAVDDLGFRSATRTEACNNARPAAEELIRLLCG